VIVTRGWAVENGRSTDTSPASASATRARPACDGWKWNARATAERCIVTLVPGLALPASIQMASAT